MNTLAPIHQVDLRNIRREPTNAQLRALMVSMMESVRARAAIADRALHATLEKEAAAVRRHYHLQHRRISGLKKND